MDLSLLATKIQIPLAPVIILVWIEFHLPLKDKDLGIERRIRLHGIHWPFAHRMTEIR